MMHAARMSARGANDGRSVNPPPTAKEERLSARVLQLENALKVSELARQRAEYKLQDLLRRLYGPKSDKIDPAQLALLTGTLEADQALRDTQPPTIPTPITPAVMKTRKGGGRRPAPEHLPIERVLIDLPEPEKQGLVQIREQITEEIDYRPSQFIRRHLVRPVYVKPGSDVPPVMAPLPARVIPQAGVGAGLLAHLLVSKYVDHLPLNRQEKIAARVGVDLPRQKLSRWVEASAQLLLTIHEQLADRIRTSGYVQVDETPVKVLDPDRGGKTAQAYLWTYHAPTADAIVFDFNLSRGRDSPERFFPTDWHGAPAVRWLRALCEPGEGATQGYPLRVHGPLPAQAGRCGEGGRGRCGVAAHGDRKAVCHREGRRWT